MKRLVGGKTRDLKTWFCTHDDQGCGERTMKAMRLAPYRNALTLAPAPWICSTTQTKLPFCCVVIHLILAITTMFFFSLLSVQFCDYWLLARQCYRLYPIVAVASLLNPSPSTMFVVVIIQRQSMALSNRVYLFSCRNRQWTATTKPSTANINFKLKSIMHFIFRSFSFLWLSIYFRYSIDSSLDWTFSSSKYLKTKKKKENNLIAF